MADFRTAALDLYRDGAPDWLAGVRANGRDIWSRAVMPDRKTEAWKYTSVRALERGAWLSPAVPSGADATIADGYEIGGLGAWTMVFVNGHYSRALSSGEPPAGVELVRFSEANAEQANAIQARLGSIADAGAHLFAALNESWLTDGVFIQVQRDTRVAAPLHVVWLTLPQDENFAVSQRLLLVMERGSEAVLVEQFASDGAPQNAFTNAVTECVVGEGAQLRHYRLHLEEEHAVHIGGVHVDLATDAALDGFHFATGGTLKRIDVVVNHRGEGAACKLNGIYLPRGRQVVDYHTDIEHIAPRCTTSEVFRGIVADRARAVFNGRIHIHPDAQKTQARLSNKNLLTSNSAEVDTQPELEIYADDVQCAHGATVAQLEEQALFYLTSRGISRSHARMMLSLGFINEIVDGLNDAAVADYLRPIVSRLFLEGDIS